MATSNSLTTRAVLYGLLIFLAGIITGALLAPLIGRTFMQPPQPQELSQHIMDHLTSELHLTNSQVAQIQPLVKKAGADMELIHRETMERVMRRLDETNAQISTLLTPAQQVEFKKMEAEHRSRLHHFHPLGEPPLPPPNR